MSRLFGFGIVSVITVGTAICYSIFTGRKKKEEEHQLQIQQLQEQLEHFEVELNDKNQQLHQKDSEFHILKAEFNEDLDTIEKEIKSMESICVDAREVATRASKHYDDQIQKKHEELKGKADEMAECILGDIHQIKDQFNEIEKEINVLRKEKAQFDVTLDEIEESAFLHIDFEHFDLYID